MNKSFLVGVVRCVIVEALRRFWVCVIVAMMSLFCDGCPLNAMPDVMSKVACSKRIVYGLRCERWSVK